MSQHAVGLCGEMAVVDEGVNAPRGHALELLLVQGWLQDRESVAQCPFFIQQTGGFTEHATSARIMDFTGTLGHDDGTKRTLRPRSLQCQRAH